MLTLSFLTGLWTGSICGTLQSSSSNSFWGIYTPLEIQGTLNHSWLELPLVLTSGNCKHLLFTAGNFCSGGQNHRPNNVVFKRCFCHLLWNMSTVVWQWWATPSTVPQMLLKSNYNAIAVFPQSLSFSINSRPMHWNLKIKREKLFNILSWQLSPKSLQMNLADWRQWEIVSIKSNKFGSDIKSLALVKAK